MKFTQFLFPNGTRKEVTIDMPEEVEFLADALIEAGWRLEIECFPDRQIVNMDVSNDDEQLASHICKNGPEVPVAVEKLIRVAHERWTARSQGITVNGERLTWEAGP